MSYYEDEEIESGFKMSDDEDEPLSEEIEINDDLGLEEDPEDRYH